MKLSFIIGVLLFIIGILGGFYLGFWIMLVGGIVDIINGIKAPIVEVTVIGVGLLKMIFSGIVGWFTFWFCTIFAVAFISASN